MLLFRRFYSDVIFFAVRIFLASSDTLWHSFFAAVTLNRIARCVIIVWARCVFFISQKFHAYKNGTKKKRTQMNTLRGFTWLTLIWRCSRFFVLFSFSVYFRWFLLHMTERLCVPMAWRGSKSDDDRGVGFSSMTKKETLYASLLRLYYKIYST